MGSLLVGSRAYLAVAHRWRKVLGGGMRQVGLLAAACLYALEWHYDRLAQDHANAERLAQGLAAIAGVGPVSQATNMVFARFPEASCAQLQAWLGERGILAQVHPNTRFVTHLDVSEADIDAVVAAVGAYFDITGR